MKIAQTRQALFRIAPTIPHRARLLPAAASFAIGVATLLVPATASAQWAPGPVPADDPFARRGWHLELGGHGALEAWNYNISHEEMVALVAGFTYGLRNGLVLTASWPMSFVSQRGTDAYMDGRERSASADASTIAGAGRHISRLRVGVYGRGHVRPAARDALQLSRARRLRAGRCASAAACTDSPASNGSTSRTAATPDAIAIRTSRRWG